MPLGASLQTGLYWSVLRTLAPFTESERCTLNHKSVKTLLGISMAHAEQSFFRNRLFCGWTFSSREEFRRVLRRSRSWAIVAFRREIAASMRAGRLGAERLAKCTPASPTSRALVCLFFWRPRLGRRKNRCRRFDYEGRQKRSTACRHLHVKWKHPLISTVRLALVAMFRAL